MNVPPKPFPEAASEPTREALLDALAERDRELAEARARHSATSEILRVISRSPTDPQPVFDSIVMAAARLVGCDLAVVMLCDAGAFSHAAWASPEGLVATSGLGNTPIDPSANFPSRAILAKTMLYLPDWSLIDLPGHERKVHEMLGLNCSLYLPLLRAGECIGLLTLVGKRPNIFGPGEIAQAESFRDQAVIAIENARQFKGTREALERQTATAEILKVIAGSPSDVQPVFDAIATSAKRLLGGYSCAVGRIADGQMHLEAFTPTNPVGDAVMKAYYPRPYRASTAQTIARRGFEEIADVEVESSEALRDYARLRGFRGQLQVPLMLDAEQIGWITVTRAEPGVFAQHHIQLLQTFADQAVIAIQNARQFNETNEALERQTATAEILKVIASSPSDVQPVFDAIATSAKRLVRGYSAGVFHHIDDLIHLVAFTPIDPEGDAALQALYPRPLTEFPLVQTIRGGFTAQFEDTEAEDVPRANRDLARARGYRAMMFTPLMHHETPIGHIVVTRKEPGKFAPQHVQLLQTFADQAVIAIQNTRLFNETQEALEQQTAAAEILRVISSSPTDVQPVFDAIARSAAELCEATNSGVFRLQGGLIHIVGHHNVSAEQLAHARQSYPAPVHRGILSGRAILDRAVAHVADIAADPEYLAASVVRAGFRSALSVPMLRNGEPIGAINVTREEARPFTDRQIGLLETFADQAVIAINNVGLFNETQEALKQQTATADVLKVISRSAFDLQTVLETLIHSAKELCGANRGAIFLRDGDLFRWQAATDSSEEYVAYIRAHPQSAGRGSTVGRVILSGKVECIGDVLEDSEFVLPANELARARATLGAPLLRDGRVEGVLVLTRSTPGLFTPRQIELVETFADQAVIAIENVRLFDEVQARTRDLSEALQQQTATADVLKVISRSAFDLDTVLVTLTGTAIQLCEATRGVIWLRKGEHLRLAAHVNYPEEWVKAASELAITPAANATTASGIAAFTGEVVNIDDMLADPRFQPLPEHRLGDYRGVLAVPMDRDGEVVGVIALSRPEARRFTDRQVALVKAFADQAVIAINNVGLFNETQEALKQQTATADVLKVISRSAFDLQTVFDTLLGSAVALAGADSGVLCIRDGEAFRCKSFVNKSPDLVRFLAENPIAPGSGSVMGRVALSGRIESIEDTLADSALAMRNVIRRTDDDRALVGVPLLREGRIEGAIVLGRRELGRFGARAIELTQTFADQAVIALENVRLFDEVQARTRDLSEALQQQTATADVLKAISRSAFDLQTVLDTLVRSAVALCDASGGILYVKSGDAFYGKAFANYSEEFIRYFSSTPQYSGRNTAGARILLTGEVQNIGDTQVDPEYDADLAANTGYRSLLGVPLTRDKKIVGAIIVARPQPVAYNQRQIELVQTFADQAVIAIENVRLFDEVQARTRDLSEALQQQTATADVLKTISRSAFDLQSVLDTLMNSAVTLCDAEGGVFYVKKDGTFFGTAFGNQPEATVDYFKTTPQKPGRGTAAARVLLTGEIQNIADIRADLEYDQRLSATTEFRAVLSVPLLRNQEIVGAISLVRLRREAFNRRQVELLQTFADQAVIAIENVRLFDEVQARTRDLTEALQQQTATSEVLKVISRSAFDLQAVWRTLVESASALCDAPMGLIELLDGDVFRLVMQKGYGAAFERYLTDNPLRAGSTSGTGRAASTGEVSHIPDVLEDPGYQLTEGQRLGGYRANLAVPLLRENKVIGVFVLARPTPGPFTQRQIELVRTFADQAVIAIENVRLFDEVQARTRDLSESLQQQTATADVLKVISRSAFDLQAVFDTLVQSAQRLCNARGSMIFVRDGEVYRIAAHVGMPEAFVSFRLANPLRADRITAVGRVALTGEMVHLADALADPEIQKSGPQLGEFRAVLSVPLVREDEVVGIFALNRPEPGLFAPGQVKLVQTFADQAAIAIANVRLFNEVKTKTDDLSEALQQQTATADVLKVISRSAFDLQVVLDTLVESAVSLIGAASGVIWLREGDVFNVKAASSAEEQQEFFAQLRARPQKPGRHSIGARVLLTGEVQIVSDIKADLEYDPVIKAATIARTLLGVPLHRDGVIIGVFVLALHKLGTFTPRQIELVQTFADQAVIAIENVRLFDEVQARTRDLSEALQQQTATADVLKVISRSAFDLDAVLQTLVESAARLCNAPQGVIHLREGDVVRAKAMVGHSGELMQRLRDTPRKAGRESIVPRVMLSGRVEHIDDALTDPEFDLGGMDPAKLGFRGLLGVPLLREGNVEGVFVVSSPKPGRFSDRQTELVQTFADQAVIAIENVRLFEQVQARTRDLSAALDRQKASADILRVISGSPTDVKPVFDAIVLTAARLFGCQMAGVFRVDGDKLSAVTAAWPDRLFLEHELAPAMPIDPEANFPSRAVVGRRTVHVTDYSAIGVPEHERYIADRYGIASALFLPLSRGEECVGVFLLTGGKTDIFGEKDVALAESFRDQALIAIENTRLFNETQEALQQQTATADVLKVISRSAFNLQAVLDTLVESAYRLSGAAYGLIYLRTGEDFECRAIGGMGAEEGDLLFKGRPIRAGRGTAAERVISTGEIQSIPDLFADPEFDPKIKAAIRGAVDSSPAFASLRSLIAVPMKRDDAVVGVIVIARSQIGLLPARQIELLQTFADQAVIAIENARLFDEVQARTRDLSEALQQQTATAEVLKVISRSAFGLKTVLQTLVDSAVRLCASDGVIYLRDGEVFRAEASFGADVAGHDPRNRSPRRPGRDSVTGRVALSGRVEQIPDNQADPEFKVAPAQRMNMRSLLGVPLLRDGEVEGVFVLGKPEPGLFSDRVVELVRTFADQAVIAIQNVRLFDAVQAKTHDLEESLQLQTATSDVLKVISRSAFDLQAVFDTLIASAVELCGAYSGIICVREGDVFRYRGSAGEGDNEALTKYLAEHPATPGRASMAGRVLSSGKVEALPDRLEDPEFVVPMTSFGHAARSLLGVPLLGKTGIEGALVLTRREPGHFTDRQVEIVQTFADQAVIAIENVRLFDEVQARTRELAASLDDLRKAQDRLIQSEKLASLGQLTAGIAHEIKNPLNFVNNFSSLSRELLDELRDLLGGAPLEEGQREEADDLIGMVASNLDKVVQHGQRADSIVKNMLLHSREGSGERSSVKVNAMVEEALNLAYHGARAEKPGFNVTIVKSLDPDAGAAELYAQEMTRVLLNLISNGFYATTKRRQVEANGAYEPTITASTRNLGDSVEIAIRDNGTGIPEEVKAKMFNPFFTTKPAGEGTGLGLSLSHDIVVKQHGGTLEVSTEPGAYTQFTVVLPRGGATS